MDLPCFMPADPVFWFSLLESIFASKNVTNSRDKFNAVLVALPPHLQLEAKPYLQQLTQVPRDDEDRRKQIYDTLKEKIIEITTVPEDRKLQELLDNAQIGTRTPSQFLNYLRNLLGNAGDENSKILRVIFLRNLPVTIKNILIAQQHENLDGMAQVADLLWESSGSSSQPLDRFSQQYPGGVVPTPSASSREGSTPQPMSKITAEQMDEIKGLRDSIEKLTRQIELMKVEFSGSIQTIKSEIRDLRNAQVAHRQGVSVSRQSTAGGRSGGNQASVSYCYFHKRFGSSAFKCESPCSFSGAEQGN